MENTSIDYTGKDLNNNQINWLIEYEKQGYHIGDTCKAVGMSRTIYYQWMKQPNFFQAYEYIRENIVDMAEKVLINSASEGNTDSSKFILRYLGKKRGWADVPTTAIQVNSDKEITIKIIDGNQGNQAPPIQP